MRQELANSVFDEAGGLRGETGHAPGVFVTTQWSLVMHAGDVDSTGSHAALERLCRLYWQPMYYFVRRRGLHEYADAQDLTLGALERLLEKGLIESADRSRGRFRTFLLAALENYLTNGIWSNRQKRGGGQELLQLEGLTGAEAAYRLEPATADTPDRLYDRRWVQTILQTVLQRLRVETDGRGAPGRFDVLKQFLLSERGAVPYLGAASQLGMTEAALKSAIHRLRSAMANCSPTRSRTRWRTRVRSMTRSGTCSRCWRGTSPGAFDVEGTKLQRLPDLRCRHPGGCA